MPRSTKRSVKRQSRKQKSQISGSFQMKARRDRIVTPKIAATGAAACPDCGAVYFDKHWHSCSEPECRLKAGKLPRKVCPECRLMKKSGRGPGNYAGEVLIDGVADRNELREIKNLVMNVAKRAAKRDPEDRIVNVVEGPGSLDIFTSENQLAVSIGRQVHQARKGGELSITWSKSDKPVRVRWQAGY